MKTSLSVIGWTKYDESRLQFDDFEHTEQEYADMEELVALPDIGNFCIFRWFSD